MGKTREETAEVENSNYFSTSTSKLLLMSLCTLGLYELYWIYKNWVHIKKKNKLEIMPFWRAFFGNLWLYSLMKYLQDDLNEANIPKLTPVGLLAALYLITAGLWNLPDPYWLIAYFSFVFIIPANTAILRLNENLAIDVKANDRMQGWNWLALILGGMFFILIVGETLNPS